MNLTERITADMKTAMKAKDQISLRGVRAIKSALLLAKTDGSGKELTEVDEIKLVQKLVKQRKDSLKIYEEQNREDLAQTEREEIEVLERYLPTAMEDAELEALIQEVINTTGVSSMRDMGKVMGMANAKVAGRADGKRIAATVKKLLS